MKINLKNNIKLELETDYYREVKEEQDGRTYEVDTSTKKPFIRLNICKVYFDITNKNELIDGIVNDLQAVIEELQLNKERKNKYGTRFR